MFHKKNIPTDFEFQTTKCAYQRKQDKIINLKFCENCLVNISWNVYYLKFKYKEIRYIKFN